MNDTRVLQVTALIIGSALLSVNLFASPWGLVRGFLVYADEYDDLLKEKKEKIEEKEILQKEAEEAAVKKKSFSQQLDYYQGELSNTQTSLSVKKALISQMEEERQKKEDIYEAKNLEKGVLMRDLYKRGSVTPLELFFGSGDFSSFAQAWYYYRQMVGEGRRQILEVSQLLEELKKTLTLEEEIKVQLEKEATVLSSQTVYYRGQVKDITSHLTGLNEGISVLEKEIAEITSRQQQLVAEKQASLNLPQSLGAGPLYCTDDKELDPGFSPAYAFYTFGIPHRVGMNQYGALGRAEDGQSAVEILEAYFSDIEVDEEYDTEIEIEVEGHGDYSIEDYVKRIYEMPSSWPMEALKAQAIAARSYALAYTNNGEGAICATQHCQVFKPDEKGGRWNEAVEETEGWVMTYEGQPIKAWYSSTSGGYTFQSNDVWGGSRRPWTKRVEDGSSSYGSFEDLLENSYDKDSPCIYAAQGWREEYDKSAWLKSEELADIANVIMLARFSDVDKNHLYQVDEDNPEGVDTWDHEKVREELSERGVLPFTAVSNVEVSGVDWDFGQTTQVNINGETFEGTEFKDWFNLRAPANIQIVGKLYNVEER